MVGFAAGEPDFDTPEFIKQAAHRRAEARASPSTRATGGIPELREAICDEAGAGQPARRSRRSRCWCRAGAKHSLYNLFQALLNEGDEVIIFAPYWVSYPDMVQLAGGKPVIVETREEDGFAPDPEAHPQGAHAAHAGAHPQQPEQPHGRGALAARRWRASRTAVRGHDCLVVSDDIYEKLLYDGPVPEHRQRGAGAGAAARWSSTG